MLVTRKITIDVDPKVLEAAQKATGSGVSETVRAGLAALAREHGVRKLLALRGKVKFAADWRELRGKDEE